MEDKSMEFTPSQWLYECDDFKDELRNNLPSECSRKGTRICYRTGETEQKAITSVSTTNEEEEVGVSETQSLGSTKESSQQEPLANTLAFEVNESNPDIDKCLQFWRTILNTHLKPTKFQMVKEVVEEKSTKEDKPAKPKQDKNNEEKPFKWRQLYEEIKRKNLDKVKLFRKVECKLELPPDFDCPIAKIETKTKSHLINKKYFEPRTATRNGKFSQSERNQLREKATQEKNVEKLKKDSPKRTFPKTFEEMKLEKERRQREKLHRDLINKHARSSNISSQEDNEGHKHIPDEEIQHVLHEPICCVCGCGIDCCLCEDCKEEEEDLETLQKEALELAREISKHSICQCDCNVAECDCEELLLHQVGYTCVCGCKFSECICDSNFEESDPEEEEDPWESCDVQHTDEYCVICGNYCTNSNSNK